MNVSAFIKQIVGARKDAREPSKEIKGHSKAVEDANLNLLPENSRQKQDSAIRAQTTQDFNIILAQLGQTKHADQLGDSAIKTEQPSKHVPGGKALSHKGQVDERKNMHDNLSAKIESPVMSNKGGPSKDDLSASSNGLPSSPCTVKLKELIPVRVKKKDYVDEYQERMKNEITEKVMQQVMANLKSIKIFDPEKKSMSKSLEEDDQEEIERMLKNDKAFQNSFSHQVQSTSIQNGYNPTVQGYQSSFGAPPVNSNFDTGGMFFSAGGNKPIQIPVESINAAKARLADMGFEDEVSAYDNQQVNGISGFNNPFQSLGGGANQFAAPFATPGSIQSIAPPMDKNMKKDKEKNNPMSFDFGDSFSRPGGNLDGPISFMTGSMSGPVNINPDMMKKAMALFAEDEENEEEQGLPPNTFSENARMGLPSGKGKNQGTFSPMKIPSTSMIMNGNHQMQNNDKINSEENEENQVNCYNEQNEQYSLRAIIDKAKQEQGSKPTLLGKDNKPTKNPFTNDPKKIAKKPFSVPHGDRGALGQKLGIGMVKPQPTKVKTVSSKFSNKIFMDNDRYTLLTNNLKKRTKLAGYCERRVTRNYGPHFLTPEELYQHFEPELRDLNIMGVNEFLSQLLLELRYQLPRSDIDQGWIEHHLKMISRKYFNKVKSQGASSSSSLDKNGAMVPYKVDLKNLITDLYFRNKKEEFFGRYSVLRRVFEGQFPPEQRMCLMVCSITNSRDKWVVELTDGWYLVYFELYSSEAKEQALKEQADIYNEFNNNLILRLIVKGMLKEGDKIEISYISFERQENQPIYMKTRIEVAYNSLRKLPWNTQMGQLYTRIKPAKLKDIKPSGGIVPMIDVLILEKRGIKISNSERDEFMIRLQHNETDRLAITFSITVIDSLHMDTKYKHNASLHMVTFRNVDPGKYLELSVGQRLQIYGVKMCKARTHHVTQANFNTQYKCGLHFAENKRNSCIVSDVPQTQRSERYHQLLDTRKKGFHSLEEIKDSLVRIINMARTDADDFMITAALKYIKHAGNLCLFHFYEKHFIQIEIKTDEVPKAKNKKDESKSAPPVASFWERVSKDIGSISETNVELILFYDLNYSRMTKVFEFKSRGKIYIHKFQFDVINDYMLGENFILNNLENSSIERYLITEYKKAKKMEFEGTDSVAQLLSDMSKYPLI